VGLLVFGAFAGLLVFCSLMSIGCRAPQLEPGGAYAPIATNSAGIVTTNTDLQLYLADREFIAAYDVVDSILTLERDNRALWWKISPEIKHTLDKVRPQAWDARNRYKALRQAYLSAPSPQGLAQLGAITDELSRMGSTIQAALSPTQSSTIN